MAKIAGNDYEQLVTFAEKKIGLLGEYPYAINRGNSIQWSPADDRLKFCWFTIFQEDTPPHFTGKIFEW